MKGKLKFKTIFLLIIFNVNAFGQSTAIENQDTSIQIKLQQFRKNFWDSLPKPVGWVNDYEGLYTNEEEILLDSIIRSFKKLTDIEICVVTIDTNFVAKEKFDSLTFHIANNWGVGDKRKDYGILIGISRGYRRMRIENGFGIEKIFSDNETQTIIDHDFIPYFKMGDYYLGTEIGVSKLTEVLTKKTKSRKK